MRLVDASLYRLTLGAADAEHARRLTVIYVVEAFCAKQRAFHLFGAAEAHR